MEHFTKLSISFSFLQSYKFLIFINAWIEFKKAITKDLISSKINVYTSKLSIPHLSVFTSYKWKLKLIYLRIYPKSTKTTGIAAHDSYFTTAPSKLELYFMQKLHCQTDFSLSTQSLWPPRYTMLSACPHRMYPARKASTAPHPLSLRVSNLLHTVKFCPSLMSGLLRLFHLYPAFLNPLHIILPAVHKTINDYQTRYNLHIKKRML